MSVSTYNTITVALLIAVVTAFVVLVVSFIAMIVRWRTPNRRKHQIRLVVALASIPCLIGLQQGILWQVFLPSQDRQKMAEIDALREQTLADTSLVAIGDHVPPFSLTTADGDEFSLPDGKTVTVINFFATWCGPCLVELPHIEQIWQANKNNDRFRLLVIGREESPESVREFREQNGFSFPIAADPDRAVYSLFATESIPRTLVVSPSGQIVYHKTGFMQPDIDELKNVLQQELGDIK